MMISQYELSRETKQNIARLSQTTYYGALQEVISEQMNMALSALANKNLPDSEIKIYQGWIDGFSALMARLEDISKTTTIIEE